MVGCTAEDAAAAPNSGHGAGEAVAAVGGHGGLDDFERLAESGDSGYGLNFGLRLFQSSQSYSNIFNEAPTT